MFKNNAPAGICGKCRDAEVMGFGPFKDLVQDPISDNFEETPVLER
jgi:hypothetical protein